MASFHATIPLRWSDLDPQGHVNNVVVLDLAQEARARFMAGGSHPELLLHGSVVVKQRSEFLRPMMLDGGPVEVELSTTSIGAARFIMSYRMVQRGELCVRAATSMCPFDFPHQRVRKLTAGERDALATISAPDEPWSPLPAMRLDEHAVETAFQPRWSDQDRYGHVNNVRTLDWLQEARVEATTAMAPQMARAGMVDAAQRLPGSWVVARQDTEYRHQLRWQSSPYLMRTGVLRVGASSTTLGCAVIDPDDRTAHVRARTVLVHAGANGRPEPLPADVREQLRSYLPTPGDGA